jgi:hypothetical protein
MPHNVLSKMPHNSERAEEKQLVERAGGWLYGNIAVFSADIYDA